MAITLETFYAAQPLPFPVQDVVSCLRQPLPTVVRINKRKPGYEELICAFDRDERFRCLEWFPGRLAWQVENDDALKELFMQWNKSYRIRIQEAASLVPPLFQRIDPAAAVSVLDMCAAPGSKTLECLEMMSPSSIMIANDASPERAMELLPMIVRKARHAGTIVTLANASRFPVCTTITSNTSIPSCSSTCIPSGTENSCRCVPHLFDHIIADVPCSGDGTARKNGDVWHTWHAKNACSLHPRQLGILLHGLHLLQVGGKLVYSTCSMNPIENEAVVATALSKYGGAITLEPISSTLPGFVLAPPLSSWRVAGSDNFYDRWTDVPANERKAGGGRLSESMFCPKQGLHECMLDGCVRLWPQQNDTSGFFIAVFTKRAHWQSSAPLPLAPSLAPRRIPWRARNDLNGYEVLDSDNDDLVSVREFYGMDALPQPLVGEYNIKGLMRQVNHVNERLLQFLQSDMESKKSPLLIAVGVPILKKMDDNYMTKINLSCRWRVTLNGAHLLAPAMRKRKLMLDRSLLRQWLIQRSIPLAEVFAARDSGALVNLESCEDQLGCAVLGVIGEETWIPCMINGQTLDIYADPCELGELLGDAVHLPTGVSNPRVNILAPLNNGIIALEKPAGMCADTIARAYGAKKGLTMTRLGRHSSGVLLLATSDDASERLRACILAARADPAILQKEFVCVVHGEVTTSGGFGECVYRLLQVFSVGEQSFSLLVVWPKKGKSDDVRHTFANNGHPLVQDLQHPRKSAFASPRLFLHCFRVRARMKLGAVNREEINEDPEEINEDPEDCVEDPEDTTIFAEDAAISVEDPAQIVDSAICVRDDSETFAEDAEWVVDVQSALPGELSRLLSDVGVTFCMPEKA